MMSLPGKVEQVEIVSPPAYPTIMQTETPQKSSTRKYVVAGVSAVVVIAIIIGAILGGLYLQNMHTRELIKEISLSAKDKDGKEVKEKVTVDAKNNEEEISADNGKFRVVEDFSKGISVMRTTINKYACYLKPLNKTGVVDPKASKDYLDSMESAEEDEDDKKAVDGNTTDLVYEPATDPIEDRSFLSARSQELCKGLDVYWMFPTDKKDNGKERSKRGLCYYIYQRKLICYRKVYLIRIFYRYYWRIRTTCCYVTYRTRRCFG